MTEAETPNPAGTELEEFARGLDVSLEPGLGEVGEVGGRHRIAQHRQQARAAAREKVVEQWLQCGRNPHVEVRRR